VNDLVLIRKNLFRKKLRAALMIVSILVAFAIFGVLASFERYLLAERALATGTVGGYVTLDQRLPILLWSDQLKY